MMQVRGGSWRKRGLVGPALVLWVALVFGFLLASHPSLAFAEEDEVAASGSLDEEKNAEATPDEGASGEGEHAGLTLGTTEVADPTMGGQQPVEADPAQPLPNSPEDESDGDTTGQPGQSGGESQLPGTDSLATDGSSQLAGEGTVVAGEPAAPADAEGPADPEEPAAPADPEEPAAPADPTDPESSTMLADPVAQPEEPSASEEAEATEAAPDSAAPSQNETVSQDASDPEEQAAGSAASPQECLVKTVEQRIVAKAAAHAAAAAASDPAPVATKASAKTGSATKKSQPPVDGWWTDPDDPSKIYFYRNGVRRRGWVVTNLKLSDNSVGKKQRYWLDVNRVLARNRVIDPRKAQDKLDVAYLALARPDGSIVCGVYTANGRIYVADSSGHLAALARNRSRGWLVSNKFSKATRRYFLYRSTSGADKGAYYAKPGYSGDGYPHFTRQSGCVITGRLRVGKRIYLADKKGRLATLKGGAAQGWLLSKSYTATEQRYYLYRSTSNDTTKGAYFAKYGFSRDSYDHFTLQRGYVLRGSKTVGKRVYVANRQGRMAAPAKNTSRGWLVSDAFSGQEQRYFLYRDTDGRYPGGYYAVKGQSNDGYAHYTRPEGYVVRGVWNNQGKLYLGSYVLGQSASLANNASSGWLVSKKIVPGWHRFYLYRQSSGADKGVYYAREGLSSDGYLHYTTGSGYVAASRTLTLNGTVYRASGEGQLSKVDPAVSWAMDYSSPTGYLILVNNSSNYVYVLAGGQGNWYVSRSFPCSSGAPATPTVRGSYYVGSRGYSFGEGTGHTCYYWTQFYGNYLFHSILYYEGTFTPQDATLGANVSHGCVRLALDNARWIHDNIPSGTRVVSY